MNEQIEKRRQSIIDRGKHAWNKEAQRFPVATREYKALLDLWEIVEGIYSHPGHGEDCPASDDYDDTLPNCECGATEIRKALEKLEKEG